MPWTNYHSHTYYCDGYNPPADYIKEAVQQQMIAYGFSSHAPVPFPCEWTIHKRKIENYIHDVNKLKIKFDGQIEIYLGLEVDYIPEISGPAYSEIRNLNLDYTIGSIHFVDQFIDGEKWCIDWTPEYFFKGLKQIFKNNIKTAVKRFFELNRMMLYESTPDLIGHFDKIRMHNIDLFDENAKWYKNEVRHLLEIIKSKDVIVEINTRGYYNDNARLYPDPVFYSLIRKMGIPVSLNSDAHKPGEITKGYQYAAEKLHKHGIDEIWCFIDQGWKPFSFDPVKGIGL